MNKIKVGEYVRTKTGNITKVIEVKDTVIWTEEFVDAFCRYNEGIVDKKDIVKHSKNIIDLIEVGDYVNGEKVIHIDNCLYDGEKAIITELNKTIYDNMIKTIVTHEQFKEMEYRI